MSRKSGIKRAITPVALLLIAAALISGESSAQPGGVAPAQQAAPAQPDIVGLRLGMSPSEVFAGMKATTTGNFWANLNTAYKQQDAVLCELSVPTSYGPDGTYYLYGSLTRAANGHWFARDNNCPRVLIGLQVMNPPAKTFDGKPSEYDDRKCSENSEEKQPIPSCELIYAEFDSTPKAEKTTVISRVRHYRQKNPLTDELLHGLLQKYGSTPTHLEDNKYGTHGRLVYVYWVYDAKGRLVDKRHPLARNSCGVKISTPPEMSPVLPGTVREGCYVAVSATISGVRNSPQLVEQFAVTLYDSSAVYRSIGGRKSLLEKMQQDLQQQRVKATPAQKEKL